MHKTHKTAHAENPMTPRRPSRNSPCPCGSGKKYKHCCRGKGFDWLADDQGPSHRALPLADEARAVREQQRQRFRQRYARELGADEPLFFAGPALEHVEHHLSAAMQGASLDPAFLHAFEQTGLLVSTANEHLIPAADLARWHAAVADYRARHDAGA
jgi:hypothetical protein